MYQGGPVPPFDPEEFQRLLNSVAKAVLAKDGKAGLEKWAAAMAAQWGSK